MSTATVLHLEAAKGLDHRTVWRWHFYAGVFCIPFVLWLSLTGTIFLFKPQIEHFLDRPYDHLSIAQRATAAAQVQAALAAVPGSTLDAYELPHTPSSAAQILVDKGAQQFRVYIHPQTLAVLKLDNEDHRLENVVFKLHGELLLGDAGSWIVELAASWAVIMILTGLFLWWPRHAEGLAGVLYPRLRAGKRTFWRDLHAVTGIYASCLVLFLLFTGLPWAKGWGSYLKAARRLNHSRELHQDWTTSSAEAVAARLARTRNAAAAANTTGGETSSGSGRLNGRLNGGRDGNMAGMRAMSGGGEHGVRRRGVHLDPDTLAVIDKMVAAVAPLDLAPPVLISPPLSAGGNWTARSDTDDRPLRVNLLLDPKTGAILQRTGFHSRPWLDRAIGTGIAAHEGRLFGLANQMLSLFTVTCLETLCISALVMWRRRRPEGVLGAPAPTRRVRFSAGLIALLIALGIYFPFLGGSMVLVLVTEKFVLRRIPATRRWLGLYPAQA